MSGSETTLGDTSRSVRDMERQTRSQTIREAFKEAKAIAQEIEDEPQPEPRRKGSGETEAAFMGAATALFRRIVQIPGEVYELVSEGFSDAFDWLNLWEANSELDSEPGADISAPAGHLTPQP